MWHQDIARIKEGGGTNSPMAGATMVPMACSREGLRGPLQPLRQPGFPTAFTAEDPHACWQTPVACFTKDMFAVGITNSHCCPRPPRERDAAAPSFQKDLPLCCSWIRTACCLPSPVQTPGPWLLKVHPSSRPHLNGNSTPEALEPSSSWARLCPRTWSYHPPMSACTLDPCSLSVP